jgi:Flp pilus assembly protein TadD
MKRQGTPGRRRNISAARSPLQSPLTPTAAVTMAVRSAASVVPVIAASAGCAATAEATDALAAIDAVLELTPDDTTTLADRGYVLWRLGRLPEAVDSFQRAIRLRPGFAMAHFNLGMTHAGMGNQALAWEEYKTLQKLDAPKADRLLGVISRQFPPARSAVPPSPAP